jgi:glycogen synthase
MVGFMKILMLGWEYPPMISGGLGTATEGLINGLIGIGHKVTLVLPHFPHHIRIPGLKIVSPENPFILDDDSFSIANNPIQEIEQNDETLSIVNKTYNEIKKNNSQNLPAPVSSHYSYELKDKELTSSDRKKLSVTLKKYHEYILNNKNLNPINLPEFSFSIENSITEKAYILGLLSLEILQRDPTYQVIHANDWMSFTAVKMIKEKNQIPVVVHIHSTEIDRSGEIHNNKNILNIEKMGINIADIVIAVSEYTKNLLVEKFNVPFEKIKVVYNANNAQHTHNLENLNPSQKNPNPQKIPVVTFVGRITFQKGPSYFVSAAEKVIKINPNVLFKVVGTGDLLPSMKQLTWELGIHKHFQFEGFLNSVGVQKALQSSDMFVMPSVSEPFGIVALEAIAQNIPIIISKQSGVSEVLNHAIKVDFWDIDLMADRILSILKYSPIRNEMVSNSLHDLNNRTWLQSAQSLICAYSEIH